MNRDKPKRKVEVPCCECGEQVDVIDPRYTPAVEYVCEKCIDKPCAAEVEA